MSCNYDCKFLFAFPYFLVYLDLAAEYKKACGEVIQELKKFFPDPDSIPQHGKSGCSKGRQRQIPWSGPLGERSFDKVVTPYEFVDFYHRAGFIGVREYIFFSDFAKEKMAERGLPFGGPPLL